MREHTLTAVRAVLADERITLPNAAWPTAITTAWDAFIGYLMLDALIGNTDRHHQNWGVLASSRERAEPERVLAPIYDHASSLGRELSDEARNQRLVTKDRRADVAAYVTRARSAFYDEQGTTLDPVTAFRRAAETSPAAGRAWLDRSVQRRRLLRVGLNLGFGHGGVIAADPRLAVRFRERGLAP